MKKLRIGIMAIIVAVIFSGAAMAAEVKIGYINLQKALNDCLAGKEAITELEAETKKRQEQVDAKQEELKKLNEEVDKKKAVWSEDMREQKQKELQAKMQEFQRFYLQSNDDLKRREQEKKTVIIKDLIELAKPMAKEKGYTFLFELQGLIYGPPEADLTADLIKVYDAEHKKEKKEKK
ncbi:MAG: OmpH family outer membrane protein [Deltaproteobacteria bacterium]|nr:OmpH family outer membrane protein [Deltaproteobacteria bacterium]